MINWMWVRLSFFLQPDGSSSEPEQTILEYVFNGLRYRTNKQTGCRFGSLSFYFPQWEETLRGLLSHNVAYCFGFQLRSLRAQTRDGNMFCSTSRGLLWSCVNSTVSRTRCQSFFLSRSRVHSAESSEVLTLFLTILRSSGLTRRRDCVGTWRMGSRIEHANTHTHTHTHIYSLSLSSLWPSRPQWLGQLWVRRWFQVFVSMCGCFVSVCTF